MPRRGDETDSLEAKAQELRREIDRIVDRVKRVDASCMGSTQIELTPQEMRYIEILGAHPSIMMRELSDHLMTPMSTATGVVDKLVTKGLVRRERVDEDRRIVRVALDEKGEEVYRFILEMHLTFSREMLAALNPDEREILLVLMRKIARHHSESEISIAPALEA